MGSDMPTISVPDRRNLQRQKRLNKASVTPMLKRKFCQMTPEAPDLALQALRPTGHTEAATPELPALQASRPTESTEAVTPGLQVQELNKIAQELNQLDDSSAASPHILDVRDMALAKMMFATPEMQELNRIVQELNKLDNTSAMSPHIFDVQEMILAEMIFATPKEEKIPVTSEDKIPIATEAGHATSTKIDRFFASLEESMTTKISKVNEQLGALEAVGQFWQEAKSGKAALAVKEHVGALKRSSSPLQQQGHQVVQNLRQVLGPVSEFAKDAKQQAIEGLGPMSHLAKTAAKDTKQRALEVLGPDSDFAKTAKNTKQRAYEALGPVSDFAKTAQDIAGNRESLESWVVEPLAAWSEKIECDAFELAEKIEFDLAETLRPLTNSRLLMTTRESACEHDLSDIWFDEDVPSWSRSRKTDALFKFAERIESEIADAFRQYTTGK